jgi:hypothetical protein
VYYFAPEVGGEDRAQHSRPASDFFRIDNNDDVMPPKLGQIGDPDHTVLSITNIPVNSNQPRLFLR